MNARPGILRAWRPLGLSLGRRTTQTLLSSRNVYNDDDADQAIAPSASKTQRDETSTTAAPAKPGHASPKQIRGMMRLMPHPLTVILAQDTSSPLPSGLLVSSFNTITLEPVPYVSFNIKLPSVTYTEIQKSGIFGASAISNPDTAKDFLLDKESLRYRIALQENVADRKIRLRTGKGGIWWMRCQFMEKASVHVGDHVVIIAKVVNAEYYSEFSKPGDNVRGSPLIYLEGRYRIAGEPVDHVPSTQRLEDARFERTGKSK
ncbi:MAG: hypothetical protein LQ346_005411 [Caloplaca aetnensis]|nr:MAG: hypothetical protein LQ346_005411 [Caloplaca aetnensis]